MRAGLLGMYGSAQLVDPVDELRVGLDELGSCPLRSSSSHAPVAEPETLLPVTTGSATASSFASTVSTALSSTETGRP